MIKEFTLGLAGIPLIFSYEGLLPSWVGIFGGLLVMIILGTDMMRLFGGTSSGVSEPETTMFEQTTTRWIAKLYAKQQSETSPTIHSWNCKNCGGPNLNRLNCEYCGKVDEK